MIINDTVTLNGVPLGNAIIQAINPITNKTIGATTTNENGEFSIDVLDARAVVIIGLCNAGKRFSPNSLYAVGDVIRPEPFEGFTLECYLSGNAGSVIPPYNNDGDMVKVGNATFIVRQYFQPISKFIPL